MADTELLDRYLRWRAMTLDLLRGLDQEALDFRPTPGLGETHFPRRGDLGPVMFGAT